MSDREEDEIDELLADSGSEFSPNSDDETDDSRVSSCSSDQGVDDSFDDGIRRRRKRVKKQLPPRNNDGGNNSNRNILYKPFDQMMSDVVFTLSGFVHPLRGDLRQKALLMGAQYKPDWDNTCTHLVCAFRDTPKYNQARGNCKIVKKDWILDCHSERKRFPWRRYSLDRGDRCRVESDDEIHESVPP